MDLRSLFYSIYAYIAGCAGVLHGFIIDNADDMTNITAVISGVLGVIVLLTTLLINIKKLRNSNGS